MRVDWTSRSSLGSRKSSLDLDQTGPRSVYYRCCAHPSNAVIETYWYRYVKCLSIILTVIFLQRTKMAVLIVTIQQRSPYHSALLHASNDVRHSRPSAVGEDALTSKIWYMSFYHGTESAAFCFPISISRIQLNVHRPMNDSRWMISQ